MTNQAGPPPLPPANTIPSVAVGAEEVRRSHLNHEASVQSIGILYYLGAILLIVGGIGQAVEDTESPMPVRILVATLIVAIGVFQFWVGTGLRDLKRWARKPTGVLSFIGLLAFPLGTLINGYILYLVFCAKGVTVFSEEYKKVIAATPHIKYRTSKGILILAGLLVLILLLLVIVGVVSSMSQ